jgi:hypothetical protein
MTSKTFVGLILCFLIIGSYGCGRTYQSIAVENLKTEPQNYEGEQITISGVPASAQARDFLSPTPLRDGYWMLVIDGVRCAETVNFENEPRIRSMLQLAESAEKAGRSITVSGRMKAGVLELKHFEGVRTDTTWYKNKQPYYSYGEYYEWYPFAYSPNSRVSKIWGIK